MTLKLETLAKNSVENTELDGSCLNQEKLSLYSYEPCVNVFSFSFFFKKTPLASLANQ